MNISAHSINNPLALIAVLAATTEASALASLPLLDVRNQQVFVWFLVGFPPFLTALFFITLNFNRQAFTAGNADPQAKYQEEPGIPEAAAIECPETTAKLALPGTPASPSLSPAHSTADSGLKPVSVELQIVDNVEELEREALFTLVQEWAQDPHEEGTQAKPCGLMLLKRT